MGSENDPVRVIKFRGLIDGWMWYVTPESDSWSQFWALVDRKTVGQYTGFKNSKDHEIYEGDVLIGHGAEKSMLVYFDGGAFKTYDGTYRFYLAEHYLPNAEIIGNIHENPDLVEKGKKSNE